MNVKSFLGRHVGGGSSEQGWARTPQGPLKLNQTPVKLSSQELGGVEMSSQNWQYGAVNFKEVINHKIHVHLDVYVAQIALKPSNIRSGGLAIGLVRALANWRASLD